MKTICCNNAKKMLLLKGLCKTVIIFLLDNIVLVNFLEFLGKFITINNWGDVYSGRGINRTVFIKIIVQFSHYCAIVYLMSFFYVKISNLMRIHWRYFNKNKYRFLPSFIAVKISKVFHFLYMSLCLIHVFEFVFFFLYAVLSSNYKFQW